MIGKPVAPSEMAARAVQFGSSMVRWGKQGFRQVSQDQLDDRMAMCHGCSEWNPDVFLGTGGCRICGCSTRVKLRLAHEKCPLGKWSPVE